VTSTTVAPDQELFKHAQGYYTARALLALWRSGLLGRAAAGEELDVAALGAGGYDPALLGGLLDYLTTRGYLVWVRDGVYRVSPKGQAAAPYFGYLSTMLGAYEPVFAQLERVVTGELVYGRDVSRSSAEMVTGLNALEANLMGQVTELLASERFGRVLDLGCGSGTMLCRICRLDDTIRGVGLDWSDEACALARQTVVREGLQDRVTIVRGDAGDLDAPPAAAPGADLVTAMFVMHEVLRQRGREGAVECLRRLAELVGERGRLLMVEVSATSNHEAQEDQLFIPEYELLHVFSNQRLASRAEWEEILAEAGMRVLRVAPADMCQAFCMIASAA
jgi:ubiquinone/menaquinone biosynthesis C-methylase UbiE